MRIACLQFNPRLGDPGGNIARADRILERAQAARKGIDLLILPELAFSGYNFPDSEAIKPYLEPTANGITTKWANKTAQELGCWVVVGYPEIDPARSNSGSTSTLVGDINPGEVQDNSVSSPSSSIPPTPSDPSITAYNSAILICPSPTPTLAGHYRKSHLYYTDYTWARPNPAETPFYFSLHPIASSHSPDSPEKASSSIVSNIRVAMGICMDMNPYRFEAPYTNYEFGTHCRDCEAALVILPTAWLTQEVDRVFPDGMGMTDEGNKTTVDKIANRLSVNEVEKEKILADYLQKMANEQKTPDWDTIEYWAGRLKPIWDGSRPAGKMRHGANGGNGKGTTREGVAQKDDMKRRKTVFVTCNRVGTEGDAVYVGSSTVLELEENKVEVKGVLGKGEEGLLIADVDVGCE